MKSDLNTIVTKMQKANKEAGFFMAKQIDLSFENKGNRGPGTEEWQQVSRAAIEKRVTYPKRQKGEKTGVKGFTQKQAQYMWSAKPLIDTGKLRSSIAVEQEFEKAGLLMRTFSGTGLPYIKTHEDGGTITVEGKTYDVPERSSHFITDNEEQEIENIFLKRVSK